MDAFLRHVFQGPISSRYDCCCCYYYYYYYCCCCWGGDELIFLFFLFSFLSEPLGLSNLERHVTTQLASLATPPPVLPVVAAGKATTAAVSASPSTPPAAAAGGEGSLDESGDITMTSSLGGEGEGSGSGSATTPVGKGAEGMLLAPGRIGPKRTCLDPGYRQGHCIFDDDHLEVNGTPLVLLWFSFVIFPQFIVASVVF